LIRPQVVSSVGDAPHPPPPTAVVLVT